MYKMKLRKMYYEPKLLNKIVLYAFLLEIKNIFLKLFLNLKCFVGKFKLCATYVETKIIEFSLYF
jgi:hypothetical protein